MNHLLFDVAKRLAVSVVAGFVVATDCAVVYHHQPVHTEKHTLVSRVPPTPAQPYNKGKGKGAYT